MTKSVKRPSRIVNGKRVISRMYRLAYRLPGMSKKKFVSLGTSDKQVAEKKANEYLANLQQEEAGVTASRTIKNAAALPLADHLDGYLKDLRATGRNEGYIYNLEKRLQRLFRECHWTWLKDITAASFMAWRSRQTSAAKTLKDNLDSARAFIKWMMQCELTETNPLSKVVQVKTAGKRVRLRRALTVDEMSRLLAVSDKRSFGYLTAYFTGLRRGELKKLQWGDVHLESSPPFLLVRASTTKNGKRADIRLHEELAGEFLKRHEADSSLGELVFKTGEIASMEMMRKDLAAAGIPYIDGQGHYADFHALRGTLNTHLAINNVDPQIRQKIMRHSDIRLTLDTYTDTTQLHIANAIQVLTSIGQHATLCATHLGISGQFSTLPVTNEKTGKPAEVSEKQPLSHELTPSDAPCQNPQNGCLTRTRTLTN